MQARILHGIDELDAATWNACANPPGPAHNPFLRHEFLYALEASGSAVARTGWQPFHLVLENERQAEDASAVRSPRERQSERSSAVVGVVPMYLKGHSQGEYVFDYAWADAWHRAGGDYYPKLQVSVPFTPATGARMLARDRSADTERALLGACVQVARQMEVSSLHVTFMPESQWQRAAEVGYLRRMDQQFHWHNPGYASFDEFLADLSSKKRKNLRRERREAVADDVEIEWLTGRDLTEAHWDAFYAFYMDTGSRKWGSPYLTRRFFNLINDTMADDVLLILCRRHGRYIAGALNFIGGDTLYGRNWGCIEDHRFLHFETCYYQAIEFAIAHGLQKVEAGAQGGHKVARGYLPEATYSAHWIADPGFRRAVADFLERERRHVEQEIEFVEERSPFKADLDLASLRARPLPPTGCS